MVELLIAITILGLVMAPLGVAFAVGLRTMNSTMTSLMNSDDEQLLTMSLPPDVQSAGNASGDIVAAPTVNTDCSGVANVLRIKWRATEASGVTVNYVSAFAVQTGSDGGARLVRYLCVDGGPPTTNVVAYNLASTSAVVATVSGRTVTFTVTEHPLSPGDPPATFQVSATRRTP